MNRTLKFERVYSLGDYKTLRIGDELEVPEELTFDVSAVSLLRTLQMAQMEKTFLEYYRMYKKGIVKTDNLEAIENSLEMIINLQTETMEMLKKYFKNGEIEK
jgi:hypothetical protein